MTVAISLLFGFAAFMALAVVHASLGAARTRAAAILEELAAADRRAVSRVPRPARVLQPRFAAA